MINFRIIIKILGSLLFIESIFLLLSAIVALIYNETAFYSLIITTGITLLVGGIAWFFNRNAPTNLKKREGYLIVSLVWIIFSLFGALPFIIEGSIPSYTDAFF